MALSLTQLPWRNSDWKFNLVIPLAKNAPHQSRLSMMTSRFYTQMGYTVCRYNTVTVNIPSVQPYNYSEKISFHLQPLSPEPLLHLTCSKHFRCSVSRQRQLHMTTTNLCTLGLIILEHYLCQCVFIFYWGFLFASQTAYVKCKGSIPCLSPRSPRMATSSASQANGPRPLGDRSGRN